MTTPQKLAQDFAAIDDYLQAAGAIARDGFMPDLTGLDHRVDELCLALQNSEPDIQQQFFDRLELLLKKLDRCEADIRSLHDARVKDHA